MKKQHSKKRHSTSSGLFAIVMLPLALKDESGLARKKDWRKTKAERSPPEEKAWVVWGGERKGIHWWTGRDSRGVERRKKQGCPEVPKLRGLCPAVTAGIIDAFSSPIQNHSILAGVYMHRPKPLGNYFLISPTKSVLIRCLQFLLSNLECIYWSVSSPKSVHPFCLQMFIALQNTWCHAP